MASVLATATILVMAAMPQTAPEPRTTCESIRGTEYQFDEERTFYLESCLNWIPSGIPILADVRYCESGGDYRAFNPNGYYGAYQFDLPTWYSVGGIGMPDEATLEEQDYRASLLYEQRGITPWIGCFY